MVPVCVPQATGNAKCAANLFHLFFLSWTYCPDFYPNPQSTKSENYIDLLPTGSEEREVLGVGSISVAFLIPETRLLPPGVGLQ